MYFVNGGFIITNYRSPDEPEVFCGTAILGFIMVVSFQALFTGWNWWYYIPRSIVVLSPFFITGGYFLLQQRRARKRRPAMDLQNLPEAFESKIRIAILAILIKETSKNFTELKGVTGAADGNLSVHLRKLEDAGYLTINKQFVNLRPQTTYTISEIGCSDLKSILICRSN